MSTTVKKQGFIAPLTRAVARGFAEERNEWLYDSGYSIRINSEGTLVYSDDFLHSPLSERENYYGLIIGCAKRYCLQFVEECEDNLININTEFIEQYSEVYYNACDSAVSSLTLNEFMQIFGENWKEDIYEE